MINPAFVMALIQNIALLLSLPLLYNVAQPMRQQLSSAWDSAAMGVLFGIISIGCLGTPLVSSFDIIITCHIVVLAIAALFMGWRGGGAALIITMVYVFLVNDPEQNSIIAQAVTAICIGLAIRSFWSGVFAERDLWQFILIGILSAFNLLMWAIVFSTQGNLAAMFSVALIAFPLAALLFGVLLQREIRLQIARVHPDSEELSEEVTIPQREFAYALLDTAVALTSTLDLETVIDHVLTNVGRVVAHDEANVMILDGAEAIVLGQRRRDILLKQEVPQRVSIEGAYYPTQMIATRQPVLVNDVVNDPRLIRLNDEPSERRSYIGVPIILNDEVMGFINLGKNAVGYFNDSHARYLQIFASQTGIAIKNAQLFEQAKALAAQEERQRLANQLHDSVTQILFSANSIAEALPRLMEKKPEKIQTYLHELSQFTRGAMAEMRSLLVELRPESLEKTDLTVLLRQLGNSFSQNTKTKVMYNFADKMVLPPEQQVVVYRIVQEVLNNIVKHTPTSQVSIKLDKIDNHIELLMTYDSYEADVSGIWEKHPSLDIMRERAKAINVELAVQSSGKQEITIALRGELSSATP